MRGFIQDVRGALPQWLPMAILIGAISYSLAGVWDAQRQVHALLWLFVGFVLLPTFFTVGLAVAASCMSLLLVLLSLPALVLGRPTGLSDLLRQLWHQPARIVPGFWAALRQVRRPYLWGALLGFAAGTVVYVAANGFLTPGK
ncbi:MAG: hypothetical protein AB8H80_07975 [Planctomycetota bacterium]